MEGDARTRSAAGPGKAPDSGSNPGPRVLVVDDDPAVTRYLARVLGRLGVRRVSQARNGVEALGVDTGPGSGIDLIICDLQMPELDGIAYLRHLSSRGFPGAVLLVSGAGERILKAVEGLGRAQDLAVIGILEKPVSLADLKAGLEKALALRASGKPAQEVRVSVDELRTALDRRDLRVFYQPQADASSRRVVGAEALVRWMHAGKGFVPPSVFIPVAEESGLIEDLADQVLDQAMAAAARWRSAGFDLAVSVNVSVTNLRRLALPEQVEERARALGLPLDRIVLELTESAFVTHLASTLEILTRLRLKGVGLSIDDFGTGYATLDHLQRIPFTELKIDRGFVNAAPADSTARTIVESSVFLARRLGISTVAEGVETEEEWNLVRDLGVDVVQGYRLARPMPEDDHLSWLEARRGEGYDRA